MTRYEQGFMRKCAECGVDGRALLGRLSEMRKQADETPATPPKDAGLGTWEDNGMTPILSSATPHSGSYYTALKNNVNTDGIKSLKDRLTAITGFPHIYSSSGDPYDGRTGPYITQNDVDFSRNYQAKTRANKIYPSGSAPFKALVEDLVNAGKHNQQQYIDTGAVTPRENADTTGIENLKLTPEQLKVIKVWQDSMVQNGGRRPVATA